MQEQPSQPPRPPGDPTTTTKSSSSASTAPTSAAEEYVWSERLRLLLGHVRTLGSRWFVYNPETGCWLENEPHIYRRKALEMLPVAKRTDRLARNVVANLESRMQCVDTTFSGAIKFEARNVVLINTRKGVLRVDSTSIKQLPHAPDFNFTCSLNVKYDPEATCPRFDKALVESLPDEQDQMLLLNYYGYTILPDTRFQLALVCHGVTGSGKSTLIEPLYALFNHESLSTSFPIESICSGKDYCLTHFQHALINVCGELSSAEVTESANFKSIVTGDVLQSRGIYDKATRLRSICKLIFLANNPPRFRNGTPAEARRLAIIHFCHVAKVEDNTLRPALGSEAEVAGVFNHMLKRLQALFSMTSIPPGGANSRAILDLFRLANAPIESFVEQHCELGSELSETKEALTSAFADFIHHHGLNSNWGKGFLKRLKEKFPMLSNYRRGHVERAYCVKGIKLRPDTLTNLEKAPVNPYNNLGID